MNFLKVKILCGCLAFLPLMAAGQAGSLPPSAEASARARAAEYLAAWARKDVEALTQFWGEQAPQREARRQAQQRFFARRESIKISSVTMTDFQPSAAGIKMRVRFDYSYFDPVAVSRSETWHANGWEIEWKEAAGQWNIWQETSLQDQLAAQLSEAGSAEQRWQLLGQEAGLVTNALCDALFTLGQNKFTQGKYALSLADQQIGLEVAEKLNDPYCISQAHALMGQAYYALGDYGASVEVYQKSLTRRLQAGITFKREILAIGLAESLKSQGNFRRAMQALLQAIEDGKANPQSVAQTQALLGLADIEFRQGNAALSLEHALQAESRAEKLNNRFLLAAARQQIGRAYLQSGDFVRAREFFAANIRQVEAAAQQPGLVSLEIDFGQVELLSGQVAAALEHYQKALVIAEKINYVAGIASAKLQIGQAYLVLGKFQEAVAAAEQVIRLVEQGQDRDKYYAALTVLGIAYRALNRTTEARRSLETAVTEIEAVRLQLTGSDAGQSYYFEDRLKPYRELVSLCHSEKRYAEALAYAEKAKARVLLDVLKQSRTNILQRLTPAEQTEEQRLRKAMTQLNQQVQSPGGANSSALKEQQHKARLAYEAYLNQLYARHPVLRTQLGEAPILSADELPQLVTDTRTALLEFVVTNDATLLFVITRSVKESSPALQVYSLPIKPDELAQQAQAFRSQLAEQDVTFRATARRLYQSLLQPAQAQLAGKTRLVIVPDGKLWELPFQALVTPKNQYLIETASVSYAPSLTVLREMQKHRERRATATRLLAFGNPALGQEHRKRLELTLRGAKFDPLPEAEAEVKAVGQLYGARGKVFIGAEAREDRLKAEAATAGILHIATHGVVNDAEPMYSYLALATPNAKEANAEEDGLLEAWELMQMNLSAELAVLSACETARGRIGAGEGVIGLAWSLFVAGVPTTVVSQWKVESSSTRQLMQGFHQALVKHSSKAEALRQAVLPLLKKPATDHPFYWAGFVLIGAESEK